MCSKMNPRPQITQITDSPSSVVGGDFPNPGDNFQLPAAVAQVNLQPGDAVFGGNVEAVHVVAPQQQQNQHFEEVLGQDGLVAMENIYGPDELAAQEQEGEQQGGGRLQ